MKHCVVLQRDVPLAFALAAVGAHSGGQVLAAAHEPPQHSPTASVAEQEGQEGIAWRGALPVENERPLQSVFLFLRPGSPEVLARGAERLGVQLDVANNLLIPRDGPNGERVEEDFEVQKARVRWARGLGSRREVSAEVALVARNGGFLDGPIQAYHDLVGLAGRGRENPLGRDARPKGRSVFFFRDAAGRGVSEGSAFGIGDATLGLKQQIAGGKVPLALRASVKIPTGSGGKLLGSGGVDGALAIEASVPLGRRVALHALGGALVWGSSDIPNARRTGLQGALALEYRGRRTSIIAQTQAATRVVRTGAGFADRAPVVVSVGFKRDVGRGRTLWASFSENGDYHKFRAPALGNIGPDLAFALGVDWRR
jgi:hypothetical protein